MKALAANPRTINAIRKADSIPNSLVGPEMGKGVFPELGSGDRYSGPWQVVKKNSATVTIKAYDGTSYFAKNYIIGGADRVEVNTDQDVVITVTGVVYIKIIYSGGTYVPTFHNAATLPDQVAGEYYDELAAVDFTDSVVTVLAQIKREIIRIAGRQV